MLQHIQNIKWIGDLSLQDADVLAFYGKKSEVVLEHGSGGSTMIFAQTAKKVYAVEENDTWLKLIRTRVANLKQNNVEILSSLNFADKVDLIFIDGHTSRRKDFVLNSWSLLKDGGCMLFHDARELTNDYKNSSRFITDTPGLPLYTASKFRVQIEKIEFNVCASDGLKSNITVIQKKQQPFYEDWHKKEQRPEWSYGSNMNVVDKYLNGTEE